MDGISLAALGPRVFRSQIGVVMQEDHLLSGSIADNICCFDEASDLAHMRHCAELAGIHDEIMRMPMAYNSLIGDMGSALSGGQKQRILLARALYRRPRLLFIDEVIASRRASGGKGQCLDTGPGTDSGKCRASAPDIGGREPRAAFFRRRLQKRGSFTAP